MDSLAFLERVDRLEPQPVYALTGDEDFLKRRVLAALRRRVLGAADDAFGFSSHAGDTAAFASVRAELETMPFLSPRRLVLIEAADPFVSQYRAALEKYVAEPARTGVLVLEVQSWPANTRLAKLLSTEATLVCKALSPYKLPDWCVQWAAAQHGKQLAGAAAELLVDLVGQDMGQLAQELTKLAVYVGAAGQIATADVDKLVGRSQAENTWNIFKEIGAGRPGTALAILDRLLAQGDDPLRILGAFSWQLRRLAQAARLHQQGQPLAAALERAGIRGGEQQLRHLGRHRVGQLYDWLLEVDRGLKGSSQLPPRLLLERLVVQLARRGQEPAVASRRG